MCEMRRSRGKRSKLYFLFVARKGLPSSPNSPLMEYTPSELLYCTGQSLNEHKVPHSLHCFLQAPLLPLFSRLTGITQSITRGIVRLINIVVRLLSGSLFCSSDENRPSFEGDMRALTICLASTPVHASILPLDYAWTLKLLIFQITGTTSTTV